MACVIQMASPLIVGVGVGLPAPGVAQARAVMRGTLVDDAGQRLGDYEVRRDKAVDVHEVKEFPYAIDVRMVDQRRWLAIPIGVRRATDWGHAPRGPVWFELSEFRPPLAGRLTDPAHADRHGQLFLGSLSDHMSAQVMFRSTPEAEGDSDHLQTLHFIAERIRKAQVPLTGRYAISESESLELTARKGVVEGALVSTGVSRTIRGHAYGRIIVGTIDAPADPNAVKAVFTLLFHASGRQLAGSLEEIDATGRPIGGSDRAFVARRSIGGRGLTTLSRGLVSPDSRLRAVVVSVHTSAGGAEESTITIRTASGRRLFSHAYRSADGQHGFGVLRSAWTRDSQFFVVSLSSSGGHQPWNVPIDFWSRADGRLRHLDDYIGPVTAPDFDVEAPNVLVIAGRRVALSSLVKRHRGGVSRR